MERGEQKAPLLDKEGLGVVEKEKRSGMFDSNGDRIHNRSILKQRRKELRNEATPAEIKLWSLLKRSSIDGNKFRRQHSVGSYILDFYCPAERLAVELDGDSHFTDEAIEYDRERTAFLNSLNIRVLRFLNTDVFNNLDSVCERVLEEIRTPSLPPVGAS